MTIFVTVSPFNANCQTQDEWSGNVKLLINQTGSNIISYEWEMAATIIDNKGKATQTIKIKLTGATGNSYGDGDSELEVDIDKETKTYNIAVRPIPACIGKLISNDGAVSDLNQDITAIIIENQPLKNDKVLSGSLIQKEGPFADGSMTT